MVKVIQLTQEEMDESNKKDMKKEHEGEFLKAVNKEINEEEEKLLNLLSGGNTESSVHITFDDSPPDSGKGAGIKKRGILKHKRSNSNKHVDFNMDLEFVPFDETKDYTVEIQIVEHMPKKIISYAALFAQQKEEEERLKKEAEQKKDSSKMKPHNHEHISKPVKCKHDVNKKTNNGTYDNRVQLKTELEKASLQESIVNQKCEESKTEYHDEKVISECEDNHTIESQEQEKTERQFCNACLNKEIEESEIYYDCRNDEVEVNLEINEKGKESKCDVLESTDQKECRSSSEPSSNKSNEEDVTRRDEFINKGSPCLSIREINSKVTNDLSACNLSHKLMTDEGKNEVEIIVDSDENSSSIHKPSLNEYNKVKIEVNKSLTDGALDNDLHNKGNVKSDVTAYEQDNSVIPINSSDKSQKHVLEYTKNQKDGLVKFVNHQENNNQLSKDDCLIIIQTDPKNEANVKNEISRCENIGISKEDIDELPKKEVLRKSIVNEVARCSSESISCEECSFQSEVIPLNPTSEEYLFLHGDNEVINKELLVRDLSTKPEGLGKEKIEQNEKNDNKKQDFLHLETQIYSIQKEKDVSNKPVIESSKIHWEEAESFGIDETENKLSTISESVFDVRNKGNSLKEGSENKVIFNCLRTGSEEEISEECTSTMKQNLSDAEQKPIIPSNLGAKCFPSFVEVEKLLLIES